MEDKTFELITKMYAEMTEQFKDINRKLDLKSDKSDIVRLENELNPKVDLALEGYQDLSEKLTTIEVKINNLATKVEDQDVQIVAIKSKKKAARY